MRSSGDSHGRLHASSWRVSRLVLFVDAVSCSRSKYLVLLTTLRGMFPTQIFEMVRGYDFLELYSFEKRHFVDFFKAFVDPLAVHQPVSLKSSINVRF